jgi:hypothetical protein
MIIKNAKFNFNLILEFFIVSKHKNIGDKI